MKTLQICDFFLNDQLMAILPFHSVYRVGKQKEKKKGGKGQLYKETLGNQIKICINAEIKCM